MTDPTPRDEAVLMGEGEEATIRAHAEKMVDHATWSNHTVRRLFDLLDAARATPPDNELRAALENAVVVLEAWEAWANGADMTMPSSVNAGVLNDARAALGKPE